MVFAEGDSGAPSSEWPPSPGRSRSLCSWTTGSAQADARRCTGTGLKALFAALPTGVEASLLTLAPQPRWVVRPTNDRVQLAKGVERLAPDESAPRMVEGLIEAAKRIDDENKKELTYFPVIVILSTTGPEGSTTQARLVDRMVHAAHGPPRARSRDHAQHRRDVAHSGYWRAAGAARKNHRRPDRRPLRGDRGGHRRSQRSWANTGR